MIIRLSLPTICLFSLLALVSTASQDSLGQEEHHVLSDVHQICPTISVSCPDNFKNGEPVTYVARVNGGNPNVVPTYNWIVSAGKIIEGQGSSSITVDTVGSAGQSFGATVTVAGFDLACAATASCFFNIEHPPNSIKFDSYGALSTHKMVSRLNAFAVQLQQQPGAQGYILAYDGRRGRTGDAKKAAARSQEYLVKTHHIDAGRIVTLDAGFKEKLTIDLWLVPTGANPPVADPSDSRSSEVKKH